MSIFLKYLRFFTRISMWFCFRRFAMKLLNNIFNFVIISVFFRDSNEVIPLQSFSERTLTMRACPSPLQWVSLCVTTVLVDPKGDCFQWNSPPRSVACRRSWTASRATPASSFWPPPTGRTSWTPAVPPFAEYISPHPPSPPG